MQITCLEMERARRCAERNSAAQRIGEIDARLAEIEREKQDLLQALAQDGGKAPRRLPGMEVKSSPQKRPAGFRIRY
jgi:hypothetical protein